MKVYKITPTEDVCNSYIVTADNKTAAVIDCAQERVYDKCRELGLIPEGVLLTHGHSDHVGGCVRFASYGIPVYTTEEEAEKMFAYSANDESERLIRHYPVYLLSGGQTITVAGIDFKVISTPGHTAGSVCYLADGCLFTGDTLFREAVGGTEFTSDMDVNRRKVVQSMQGLKMINGTEGLTDFHLLALEELDFTYANEDTKTAWQIGFTYKHPFAQKYRFELECYYRDYLSYSRYESTDFRYEFFTIAKLNVMMRDKFFLEPYISYFRAEDREHKKAASNLMFGVAAAFTEIVKLF